MVKPVDWKSAAARKLIELSGGAKTIEQAIEAMVSKLLEAVPFPPTELDVLAKLLGVVDICNESLAVSGELRRLKNGFQIICSADLDAGRRRFTIAHEIGHVVLASCGTKCSGAKELERLCDKIAAEILMPAVLFRSHWGVNPSIADVFRIMKLFQTSLSATATRAHELCGAAAFEIRDRSVTWCKGIRSAELIELRDPISDTVRGQSIDEQIYLRARSRGFAAWRLQGVRIGQRHAFFLVTPARNPA
jgi:Zn-dependent peptidase ImmA (M78 family)